jgi:tetratricopeptide (TPR) repeat protein
MPLADPRESFEVAARHLFRHLGDVSALRRNPLAHSFFQGPVRPKSDRLGLVELRDRVLDAARECLRADIAAGRRKQGERSYKIIVAICNSIDPKKTAHDLKLSIRQYYRDRKDISRRVACGLVNTVGSRAIQTDACDAFHLLVGRAASLVEEGCAGTSVAMLERALPRIDHSQGKVVALLTMSSAYVQHGNVCRAQECLEAARYVQNRGLVSSSSDELLDLIGLTSVEVALADGSDRSASAILESIITRSQQKDPNGSTSRDLVLLDVLLEKCSFDAMNGRFQDARRVLADASAVAMKLSVIPPRLTVFSAVMAAHCCEDGSASPDQTLARYSDALHLSVSNNSARGAFYALNGQSRAFLRLGDEQQAYQRFREAAEVARSMEGTKFLVSAAIAGTSLIGTEFWREVAPLMDETRALVQPNSLKSAQLMGARGALLSRIGKPAEALEALTSASELLAKLRNDRFLSNVLRERAIVLRRMGRTREASSSINVAIELAKQSADVVSLRQTYFVAAGMLDDKRLSTMANRTDRQVKR